MSFDEKAKNWDDDPQKLERSKQIADGIAHFLSGKSTLKALEFGAGTGTLSFLLKDYFDTVHLIDNSEGMLEVLNEKIKSYDITNFNPLNIDLFDEEIDFDLRFDIIYTAMALHHVENLESIIAKFSSLLNNGGFLFIADLCPEDGNFHQGMNMGVFHNGIDIPALVPLLNKYGISQLDYKIIFHIFRIIDNKNIDYPVFLYSGQKE